MPDAPYKVSPITLLTVVAVLVFGLHPPTAYAEAAIGKLLYSKGVVSGQMEGRSIRILGRDSDIYLKDTLTTGKRSFAVMEFSDGTKLTVRPGSILKVEDYAHGDKRETAVFSLIKGGLRAITGLIGKLNPGGYSVQTPVATLGIRGTEFDARICAQDCATEEKAAKPIEVVTQSKVIARVALRKGGLKGRDITGKIRDIATGGPVYKGDTLITAKDAFAVIAFRDDTRITLQPDTEFVAQDYRYQVDQPGASNVLFNLIKGGLRAVTGAIGKLNPSGFKVRSPTATIGIRGTGFDFYHSNPTHAWVWLGEITFESASGTLVLTEGQTVFLPRLNAKPIILNKLPVFIQKQPGPRPDKIKIDLDKMFGATQQQEIKPGLWVFVHDGHVRVNSKQKGNKNIDLGAGEGAFADGDDVVRVEIIPAFMLQDIYPRPGQLDPRTLKLLGTLKGELSNKNVECEVK
ncbi:MAG: FecR domain-containing protein [Gammaproteobacteria bacterium]|nr:FecR domain-containing protein [Gammaproteobacteria bacterium]